MSETAATIQMLAQAAALLTSVNNSDKQVKELLEKISELTNKGLK